MDVRGITLGSRRRVGLPRYENFGATLRARKDVLRGTDIQLLYRHRLFRRGDARLQLQRAPGLRRRGHRHAGTGSAAAEPTPLLDAQRLGSSSSRSSLVSDSARTYVLVNYERMTQSSDALLSHLRGDSHTAVDGNIEHLVRDGLRQDVSHV